MDNNPLTRAEQIGGQMAEEMRDLLERFTPQELGYKRMTAEELIESERRCWIEEEMQRTEEQELARRNGHIQKGQ